jgi:hypothetical protein
MDLRLRSNEVGARFLMKPFDSMERKFMELKFTSKKGLSA